jgi:deoxyadenosine/deoxycytidine kinase
MAQQQPLVISVEGNIGSGKSTLLAALREKYAADETVGFVDEPVDVWDKIKDSAGKSILAKYYENQQKYAFSFQMMAYISRLSAIRQALRGKHKIIIMERSIYTDSAVFAKMLHDDGKIEEIEYKIYMEWFNEFANDLPPISVVYVRADPEICLERIVKRGRAGEQISLAYLENCHKYHENWLFHENKVQAQMTNNIGLLTLNGNADINAHADAATDLDLDASTNVYAQLNIWTKSIHDWFISPAKFCDE